MLKPRDTINPFLEINTLIILIYTAKLRIQVDRLVIARISEDSCDLEPIRPRKASHPAVVSINYCTLHRT
jgi:hypothetical protein